MKRCFTTLLILACTCATIAFSSNDDRQQVYLGVKHDYCKPTVVVCEY